MAEKIGWSGTLAVYMVLALICIFLLWKNTKGYERHAGESESAKFSFGDVKALMKNKSARIVMIIFALAVFGNSINLSIQTYYYIYCVELTSAQIATVMLASGIISCFATIGVDFLCKKISKKMAWIIAAGLEGISMIILIAGVIKPGQIGMIYLLVLLMALGLAAIYQIPWSMIPDCVDVNELETGRRTDGIVFGFIAFIQKVAGAIAIALVGTILTLIKYNPAGIQTAETIFGMKMVYGIGCGGVLILTVLIVLAYPLSKKRHDDVLEALAARERGEEINMDDFKDLI